MSNLLNDLHVAAGQKEPDYGTYVDRYGKESKGSVTFNEVKEMYMAHVHYADLSNPVSIHKEKQQFKGSAAKKPAEVDENLLRALFNTISNE